MEGLGYFKEWEAEQVLVPQCSIEMRAFYRLGVSHPHAHGLLLEEHRGEVCTVNVDIMTLGIMMIPILGAIPLFEPRNHLTINR